MSVDAPRQLEQIAGARVDGAVNRGGVLGREGHPRRSLR
jgi:hypothetical protein